MKEIKVINWCDHPVCLERRPEMRNGGQDVKDVQVWFYTRGAKREPIKVELCPDHEDEMRSLYQALSKFDQNKVD